MMINKRSSFQLSKSNAHLIESAFQALHQRGLIAGEATSGISVTRERTGFHVQLNLKGSAVASYRDVSVSQQSPTYRQAVRLAFEKAARALNSAKRKKRVLTKVNLVNPTEKDVDEDNEA